MRRTLPLLLAALLLAACSDGDDPAAAPATSVAPDADLPPAVAAFLDGVAEPAEVPFRATYRVLRKLGGGEHQVEVVAAPPSWQVRVDDLVFVDGPKPATCRASLQRCVGEVREALLTEIGVFSRFFATAPAQAVATDARRESAGAPVSYEQETAGLTLQCLSIPQSGRVTASYCLTDEGVFGYVDTPAVRYELVRYEPGPPGEPTGVPYPIVADGSFLTR